MGVRASDNPCLPGVPSHLTQNRITVPQEGVCGLGSACRNQKQSTGCTRLPPGKLLLPPYERDRPFSADIRTSAMLLACPGRPAAGLRNRWCAAGHSGSPRTALPASSVLLQSEAHHFPEAPASINGLLPSCPSGLASWTVVSSAIVARRQRSGSPVPRFNRSRTAESPRAVCGHCSHPDADARRPACGGAGQGWSMPEAIGSRNMNRSPAPGHRLRTPPAASALSSLWALLPE